jgi:nitrogen-specific signal transduction histidine kinase/CheY-like chemotaxis protein
MNNGEKEMIGFPQGGVPHRILVIDDNPDIHRDFKTILLEEQANTKLDSLGAELFGRSVCKSTPKNKYELDFASQGKEGHEKIKQALSQNRPYELAFVDMRMPPGWDGLVTIEHIWKTDPNIQVVICTAYSDYSWEDISQRLGRSENLLILKKPFDSVEIAQLATALTEKWTLAKRASMKMDQLEQIVQERTHKLATANEQLQQEIAQHKRTEEALRESRERFQKQNEFLNTVLDSLTYPFYVIDACDYTIKMSNLTLWQGKLPEKATCHMVSHKRDKPCDEADHTCPLKVIKKTGKPVTVEHIHYDKDGNPRYVEVHAYPIFDSEGNVSQITEYCIDITERKQSELNQNELIKKVDKINRELNDFASIVSHDLKAPLRGIKTLANWILADCADKLGDQANEQINLLLERVERMYNLIEGALQYSRLGQTKGKQIQVNLNNFVPEIINMVVPPENITVTIENELPVIEFEETHIMQVFQNLLSNAIKYMDKPKGWIKIGCVEQDGFWKFSVADNGPGIEDKHFEKIFKIFQALPTSPMFEGTGVGLTIAKKIVELYNGKIWVESKVGQGSTFFFTLPKQKEPRLAGTKMGAKK